MRGSHVRECRKPDFTLFVSDPPSASAAKTLDKPARLTVKERPPYSPG